MSEGGTGQEENAGADHGADSDTEDIGEAERLEKLMIRCRHGEKNGKRKPIAAGAIQSFFDCSRFQVFRLSFALVGGV